MPQNFLYPVISVPDTHFTEALAGTATTFTPPFAASAMYNLPGVPPIGSRRFLIRAIQYIATQNVGLEFDLYGSALGATADVDTNTFISRYQFASANGVQSGGQGPWLFYVDGLAVPYLDQDSVNSVNPPTLHLILQNCDTVAKSAGEPGEVAVTVWLEPLMSL